VIVAVVPVAFFTAEHVEMTARFLTALDTEVDATRVYHNGGSFAAEGWRMLSGLDRAAIDADGWPFYRMWNDGIATAVDVALVLNNDIEWEPGALRTLAEVLVQAPEDVAIASPSPNGEPRHCFAIRPALAPKIDERYRTWYGDTELEEMVKRSGNRLMHFDPGIRHPHIQTTTDHLPGIHDMRLADMRLFDSKWA